MSLFTDSLSILYVILWSVLLFFAANKIIAKIGFDQKSGTAISSPVFVFLAGTAFNLVIALGAIFLYTNVSTLPLKTMGFGFNFNDLLYCVLIFVITFLLAFLFAKNKRNSKEKIKISNQFSIFIFTFYALNLIIAAFQEEVIYRGYIISILIKHSWLIALLVSTIAFTLVHFITTKITLFQTINWISGGITLFVVYILSGSIWIVTFVHLARNLMNGLFLLDVPNLSIVKLDNPLTNKTKSIYYGLLSLLVITTSIIFYL